VCHSRRGRCGWRRLQVTTAADSVLVRGRHAALSRRWLQVFAAAMFINTSYGTLSYAFSVLVTDSGPGGDFGAGTVSLGFGLALLVSGVTAISRGRWRTS